jgi:hypothetical protein
MKTLTRTIIALISINSIVASSAFAGNVADEPIPNSTKIEAKQANSTQQQVGPAQRQAVQKQSAYGTKITVPRISTGRNVVLGSPFGSTRSVLVIPSAEITTEDIATINEDMNIMSRILEKNLERANIDVGSMFIPSSDPWNFNVVFGRGRQTTQSMYLQGFAALFLMKVDFPLSPGPRVDEEKKPQQEKEQDVDPVWTETKQDLFEPEKSRKEKSKRPKQEYDVEQVENLKTTLIQSLKHAANIRNLKPDESVILTVTGSGTSSGIRSMRRIPETDQVIVIDDNNNTRIIQGGTIREIGLSLPTVLVIRAKKPDIDRFAQGDLDFDQFQQNTQIITSAYLTDPLESGNPFTGNYYFNYDTNP